MPQVRPQPQDRPSPQDDRFPPTVHHHRHSSKKLAIGLGIIIFIFSSCIGYNYLMNSTKDIDNHQFSDTTSTKDITSSTNDMNYWCEYLRFPPDQQINAQQTPAVTVLSCTIEKSSEEPDRDTFLPLPQVTKKIKLDTRTLLFPCELDVAIRKSLFGYLLPTPNYLLPELTTLGFINDNSFTSFKAPSVISGKLRAVLTEDIAPIVTILIRYHQLLLPNDETLENINPEMFKMENRDIALVYYIITIFKTGRAYRGMDMYKNRYAKHNYEAYTMSEVDYYSKALIDELYEVVKKVYQKISEGVDFNEMTPDKLMKWQDDNHMSGFFLLQLHQIVERDAWKLRGMPLTTILTFVEAMTQVIFGNRDDLPYDNDLVKDIGIDNMIKIRSGIEFEQFHDKLLPFYIRSDTDINKHGKNTLAKIAVDLGAPLNWFHFLNLSSQVSWKPGNTFADGWDPSTANNDDDSEEVYQSISDIVKEAMQHNKDDELIAVLESVFSIEITPDEANAAVLIGTQSEYTALVETKMSLHQHQQKFISVTDIEMSLYHGKWNNRVDSIGEALVSNDSWYDPIPGETPAGKKAYDTSEISDGYCNTGYDNSVAFIEDTQKTHHVEGIHPMYVVVRRDFEAASICFRNKVEFNNKREAMLELAIKKGYMMIDEVLGVTTLGFMNADCQFSYITVHPPFFLGLESRPPYAPGFSNEQQNNQIDAAGRFHYLRGLKVSLEPHPSVPIVLKYGGGYKTENDSIYGNYFFAAVFNKYGTLRYHAERIAQVAVSKDLLLYRHPSIKYLTEEYVVGLWWKSINKWERNRSRKNSSGIIRDMFIGEQMIRAISCSVDKQAAIKITSDGLLIKDLNGKRRPHFNVLRILKRMKEKLFPENGSPWLDQILAYVIQEHEGRKAERAAVLLDVTYQRHKKILVKAAENLNNWHPVQDEYVLQFPSSLDYYSTWIYLGRLKNRNLSGDNQRRADLETLGWTFDDLKRNEAQMSKWFSDNKSTVNKGQAAADAGPADVGAADMIKRLKSFTAKNAGVVKDNKAGVADTAEDLFASLGLS